MNKIHRPTFFQYVRNAPFNGRVSETQADGLNKILDYKEEKYPKLSLNEFAYILATAFWESGRTMQPVREKGGEKYLRSKKYYPWVGEGLVQITWERNHKKFGATAPGQMMTWPRALDALFRGMILGMFTGKRLNQYFNDVKEDPREARRIVNGTDKAGLIADFYHNFKMALVAATTEEKIKVVEEEAPDAAKPDKPSILTDKTTIGVLTAGGGSVLASLLTAVSNPYALAAFALVVVGIGLALYGRHKLRKKEGV
jgi:hypothetical protein